MLCINSTSDNPYFNLACEEYLLRNFTQDIFFLYINQPSIIVGKHQNAISEINIDFVKRKNIKVARRLSGGGTVFHDFGNLNFCFIKTAPDRNLINFSKFVQPVIEVLQQLGMEAIESKRNDILVEGLKVSGNAEHVYKQRVLHHGTLLFDSKLENLAEALKVNLQCFTDRSVQSRRSNVTNISGYLQKKLSIDEFRSLLFEAQMKLAVENSQYYFSSGDIEAVNQLMTDKYSTWEWNFGYSPKYEFRNFIQVDDDIIGVFLLVEKGIIKEAELNSKGQNPVPLPDITPYLLNQRHWPGDLEKIIDSILKHNKLFPLTRRDFKRLLFYTR